MDTEKLRFTTDENGFVVDKEKSDIYKFWVVGYRNTRGRDAQAEEAPFEWQISNCLDLSTELESVLAPDLPVYGVQQYVGLVVLSLILTGVILYILRLKNQMETFFENEKSE